MMLINPYILGSPPAPPTGNTVALLHMEGSNGGTVFTDEVGHTFTGLGSATTSTDQAKAGSTSLKVDGSSGISSPANSDWDFAADPFTLEAFVYLTSYNASSALFSRRSTAVYAPFELRVDGSGLLNIFLSNSTNNNWAVLGDTYGSRSIPLNQWVHVAWGGNGSKLYAWIGGLTADTDGKSYSGMATSNISSSPMVIGRGGDGGLIGYVDEVRVTKGQLLYTPNTSFTPPSTPLPNP